MLPHLTIDLRAVCANYDFVKSRIGENCVASAVVKSNAYGLGVGPVAQALYDKGCRLFFVATLPEALELRMILGDTPDIAMLNGFSTQDGTLYSQSNIIPVLNSPHELSAYQALAKGQKHKLPAILQIDTGMNRLGFDAESIQTLSSDPSAFKGIEMRYIMSHFACADEKGTSMNADQYDAFLRAASLMPNVPKSIANSSGLMRKSEYHLDMVRPGMALYGLNPTPEAQNPMQNVVALDAPILQIRSAEDGESCGYNATFRFDKKTSLAILPIGYADGILRALSNKGMLYWKGIPCPIRGHVSMDLTIVDLGAIPPQDMPMIGDRLEIIGAHQSADDIAAQAGTIGYELLTSLSRRYERRYIKD